MRRWLWPIFGLGLVACGVVVVLTAPAQPYDAGWFAYTPLGDGADWYMEWEDGDGSTTAALVLTRQHVVGFAVTALGVLVVATGVAYRLGRRSKKRAQA